MTSNLDACNKYIDLEFRKYKSKLEKMLCMGQITYDEFIKVQKSLIYKQSKLKMKAIELFLDTEIPKITFKEILKIEIRGEM